MSSLYRPHGKVTLSKDLKELGIRPIGQVGVRLGRIEQSRFRGSAWGTAKKLCPEILERGWKEDWKQSCFYCFATNVAHPFLGLFPSPSVGLDWILPILYFHLLKPVLGFS